MLTLHTFTHLLAYLHYYTPKRLPGRWLAARHLRQLAARIGLPRPDLRALRRHPLLAAHVALAHAAGLVAPDSDRFSLQPGATDWLHAAEAEQIAGLLDAFAAPAWSAAVQHLKLDACLTLDYVTYLRQQLARRPEANASPAPARWLQAGAAAWRLALPRRPPPWLLFDLLQLGEWQPEDALVLTPLTIASAPRRGYGRPAILWLLEQATQEPLSPGRAQQIDAWLRQGRAYSLRTVTLLSAAQDTQLATLYANRRLRPHLLEQLSPRHAIVAPDAAPKLARWLARQALPLQDATAPPLGAASLPAGYIWLGLRLLVGLGELIPLPYPAPHGALATAAAVLMPEQLTVLEQRARCVLDALRAALHGRDAFFPAPNHAYLGWVELLERAIAHQQTLCMHYQALGAVQPGIRRILPLRLERRGALIYLHAYCYRAEANLVFRLDRISALEHGPA